MASPEQRGGHEGGSNIQTDFELTACNLVPDISMTTYLHVRYFEHKLQRLVKTVKRPSSPSYPHLQQHLPIKNICLRMRGRETLPSS